MLKPGCYDCKFRKDLDGDTHSRCANPKAEVVGEPGGIRGGWFHHPFNFDPVWLKECTGFSPKESLQED